MNTLHSLWIHLAARLRRAFGITGGTIKMSDKPEIPPNASFDPITLWPDEYALALIIYRDKRVVLLRDVGVTREAAQKALEKIVPHIVE